MEYLKATGFKPEQVIGNPLIDCVRRLCLENSKAKKVVIGSLIEMLRLKDVNICFEDRRLREVDVSYIVNGQNRLRVRENERRTYLPSTQVLNALCNVFHFLRNTFLGKSCSLPSYSQLRRGIITDVLATPTPIRLLQIIDFDYKSKVRTMFECNGCGSWSRVDFGCCSHMSSSLVCMYKTSREYTQDTYVYTYEPVVALLLINHRYRVTGRPHLYKDIIELVKRYL